jgi:hypothetical protein
MNSARQLSRDSNHDGITAPRTNHLRGMSLCDPQPRILARLDPELSATSCCPLAARRCCSASRGPTEIQVGRCCCHRYPGSRGGLRTRSALRCRDSGIRSSIALLTARLASSRPGSAGADSWSLPRARAHARAGPRKIVACLKVGAGSRPELRLKRTDPPERPTSPAGGVDECRLVRVENRPGTPCTWLSGARRGYRRTEEQAIRSWDMGDSWRQFAPHGPTRACRARAGSATSKSITAIDLPQRARSHLTRSLSFQ